MERLPPPSVLRAEISHFAFALPDPADEAALAGLEVKLPPELARAVPRRRAEFLAGRYGARLALRAAGCQGSTEVGLGPDRAPRWPEGFTGSITHCRGYVAAAAVRVGAVLGLGIDAEPIVRGEALEALLGHALLPAERLRLERGEVPLDAARFATLVFSAKESLYKCLHPHIGRFFEFADAQVLAADGAALTFTLCLTTSLARGFPAGRVFAGRFQITGERMHTAIELQP